VFLGHFAIAFAAKKAAPEVSLGTLFIAGELADLLWPVFFLLGVEDFEIRPGITAVTPFEFTHYPYSHSLLALLGWAIGFAGVYAIACGARLRVVVVLAATVLSHWALDVLTHISDMPVTIHGELRLGLGLWNSLAGTLLVEFLMFAAGLSLYARATRALDRTGRVALWSLAAFLVVIYIGSVFGPPPPSKIALALTGLAMWLLIAWAYWVDRHRQSISAVSA
jgi:hypothetical protein